MILTLTETGKVRLTKNDSNNRLHNYSLLLSLFVTFEAGYRNKNVLILAYLRNFKNKKKSGITIKLFCHTLYPLAHIRDMNQLKVSTSEIPQRDPCRRTVCAGHFLVDNKD